MRSRPPVVANQLSFEALLTDALAANEARIRDRQFGHLPGSVAEALPFFRDLIALHHNAMLGGDADAVASLRQQAHDLATKLNNYEPGIIADENAPGCVLERLTRAEEGQVPLWGQSGSFEVRYKTMRVCIEMEGLFGIGASHMAWLGFSAHAIEKDTPFLSDTGYRSFLGVGGPLCPGYTVDQFAVGIVGAFVEKELKGKLQRIVPIRTFKETRSGAHRRARLAVRPAER